jgi:deoxyribonuclease V
MSSPAIGLNSKFSVERAHAAQQRLSERVVREDRVPETVRYVGGVDVAYTQRMSIGAVAVLDFDSLSLVESQTARVEMRLPYVPTLLSFREIPPAFSAIRRLLVQPDVFLVDGQGFAHPYRFGFATHLGLMIDRPTIGVAKGRLCGEVKQTDEEEWMPLVDGKETVGAEVVTREGYKPIYVSVGHKISLERAIEIVNRCTRGCRIPEPARKAHAIANNEKKAPT